MNFLKAFVLPGMPQLWLCPEANPGWARLAAAFERVRENVEEINPDVVVIYSTSWPSVLGHQILTLTAPQWVHVDEDFHELGSIPYAFQVDRDLGEKICEVGKQKGLHMHSVPYHGFPLDTQTVVIMKYLTKNRPRKFVLVSSNIYADRAETIVLGKAVRESVIELSRSAVVVAATLLSNRFHQTWVPAAEDKISSLKDQEWNLKLLEFFQDGRLEDVSQLSRQFHREARVLKVNNYKPFWWLAAVMGQTNDYRGEVLEYQSVYGTGCAVIELTPGENVSLDLEFDEDDPELFLGERNVLSVKTGQERYPDFVAREGES